MRGEEAGVVSTVQCSAAPRNHNCYKQGNTGAGLTIGGHLYLKELFHLELLFKSKNNALEAVFYQTIPVFPALKTAPWLLSSPN